MRSDLPPIYAPDIAEGNVYTWDRIRQKEVWSPITLQHFQSQWSGSTLISTSTLTDVTNWSVPDYEDKFLSFNTVSGVLTCNVDCVVAVDALAAFTGIGSASAGILSLQHYIVSWNEAARAETIVAYDATVINGQVTLPSTDITLQTGDQLKLQVARTGANVNLVKAQFNVRRIG